MAFLHELQKSNADQRVRSKLLVLIVILTNLVQDRHEEMTCKLHCEIAILQSQKAACEASLRKAEIELEDTKSQARSLSEKYMDAVLGTDNSFQSLQFSSSQPTSTGEAG